MSKGDYLEDAILDHVLGGAALTQPTPYLALSSADPLDTGAGLAEPAGAWYARINISADFAAASGGSKVSNAEIDFTAAGADTVDATDDGFIVTHFAIMDAVTGGNLLYHGSLSASKTLSTGDEVKFASGDLTINED